MIDSTSDADHSPSISSRAGAVGLMIVAAALFRLLPHPPNFTPIGAIALFGGAALANRRLAFLLPLAALLLSDLYLGFYEMIVFVYAAFLLIALLGRGLRKHRRRPIAVAGAAVAASLLFFIVSNFGVWLMSGMYTHTWGELVRCYVEAIPFFGNTVAGDVVFSTVLFGGLAFLESRSRVTEQNLSQSSV